MRRVRSRRRGTGCVPGLAVHVLGWRGDRVRPRTYSCGPQSNRAELAVWWHVAGWHTAAPREARRGAGQGGWGRPARNPSDVGVWREALSRARAGVEGRIASRAGFTEGWRRRWRRCSRPEPRSAPPRRGPALHAAPHANLLPHHSTHDYGPRPIRPSPRPPPPPPRPSRPPV